MISGWVVAIDIPRQNNSLRRNANIGKSWVFVKRFPETVCCSSGSALVAVAAP